MNISYNWLKEYVSFDLEPQKISEILTFIGLEVEDMEQVEEIPGGLQGVVVGEVIECDMHPDSDHLHITKVAVGQQEPLNIVCGAPNVAAGQKVLVATVGTKLPTPDGEGFKIKKSKIRGVESVGMICAEDELGIGTSHEGIMVLESSAIVGTPAKDYLKLSCDTVYTIGLTPNRVDGASHIGVARDLSAYLKLNNLGGELTLPDVSSFKEGDGDSIKVFVEDTIGSPRYVGITMSGVKIAPSPEWLKIKLNTIGIRSINNVVDITNFILQETGQPLHSFDASMIEGGEVHVKRANEGEKFVTLDGVERTLSSEDLMICNKKSPMCIAGVFGGLKSGVTDNTTSVFIESAYFNPVSIRKTSKRHTLKTDASFRYERGADPMIAMYAAKRAALLIEELAGGKVVGKINEVYPEVISKNKVEINFDRMESLIGKKIGGDVIIKILTYLDFEIIKRDDNGAEVLVPSYRVDVTRECDVVEEVLRIYGYNNIELPSNVKASINSTPNPDPEMVKMKACDLLAANGFMECMNNSLTKGDYYSSLKSFPEDNLVKIFNPLSNDLNVMRQTLLFSGLEVIAYNLNRQASDLKLFEMGNVYSYIPKQDVELPQNDHSSYKEESHLSMFLVGKGTQYWRNKTGVGHFFTLKGYVELLLRRFGMNLYDFDYSQAPKDLYSEGIQYSINNKVIATIGVVSPTIAKRFDIKLPVFAADINWGQFLKIYSRKRVRYSELPKFPGVKRDLALLIDDHITFAQLREKALKVEKKLLRSVVLFDVYKGDKIPQGKKQYAISYLLRDDEKTLTDQYVEQIINKILDAYIKEFNVSLR